MTNLTSSNTDLLDKFLTDFAITAETYPNQIEFTGGKRFCYRLVWRGVYLTTDERGGEWYEERHLTVFLTYLALYQQYLAYWSHPHLSEEQIALTNETLPARGQAVLGYEELKELLGIYCAANQI